MCLLCSRAVNLKHALVTLKCPKLKLSSTKKPPQHFVRHKFSALTVTCMSHFIPFHLTILVTCCISGITFQPHIEAFYNVLLAHRGVNRPKGPFVSSGIDHSILFHTKKDMMYQTCVKS